MSRVKKCCLHSGFESIVKKPEFLGRFCIIEQFTFLRVRGAGCEVKNTEKI